MRRRSSTSAEKFLSSGQAPWEASLCAAGESRQARRGETGAARAGSCVPTAAVRPLARQTPSVLTAPRTDPALEPVAAKPGDCPFRKPPGTGGPPVSLSSWRSHGPWALPSLLLPSPLSKTPLREARTSPNLPSSPRTPSDCPAARGPPQAGGRLQGPSPVPSSRSTSPRPGPTC